MNKADCIKLRTGDVLRLRRGWKDTYLASVTGKPKISKHRGARIPVRRHSDDMEYTVYSSTVVTVVYIAGMPTPTDLNE